LFSSAGSLQYDCSAVTSLSFNKILHWSLEYPNWSRSQDILKYFANFRNLWIECLAGFLDHVFGTKEALLREQCDWVPFLDHKAYMNQFCEIALRKVEAEIFKDYLFILAWFSVRLPLFSYDLKTIFVFWRQICYIL